MVACVMRSRWTILGGLLLTLGALPAAAGEPEKPAVVPLKRAILYTSGVGFFEHAGEVKENARVELTFSPRDMDDLLMSLVVEDLGGGKVSRVNYAAKTPITQLLKTFSLDLASNPSLAQLLNQMRGEAVEVEVSKKVVGTILGVEKRRKQVGTKDVIESDILNVLTDAGLEAFPLDSVSRIKLVNTRLNTELRKALAVLATSHATENKSVILQCEGKGPRPIRIGYIQEMPVWRTTYRLVVEDKKPPHLQGWANVENTTDTDWNDIGLTLVSGQPISFKMDLYQPLFVARPQVQLPVYSSLRPQTYGGDLDQLRANEERRAEAPMADRKGGAKKDEAARAPAPMGGMMAPPGPAGGPGWSLQQGVQAAARAGSLGELFQYEIASPVSVARQQSAMLPIVNTQVRGEKVAIYDQTVDAKHPLNGLRLTNSTGLFLMQGPITVFEEGAFAGDAMIENIPPGAERLISYSVDLDVEVAPESKSQPEHLLSVKLNRGTMQIVRKLMRVQDYTLKNSGKKAHTVLVVYPKDANWNLVEPKAAEITRDKYRFAVQAKPGAPARLKVVEEQMVTHQVAITNLDNNSIQIYLSAKVVNDEVKTALTEVVKKKQAIQEVTQKRQQLQQQIQGIVEEQARIRQNMAQLDKGSDLYKRYVKMFSEQEDQVARFRDGILELTRQETTLRAALDAYINGLNIP